MARELAEAFLARLTQRDSMDALSLASELAEVVARARQEAPGIELDPTGFVGHLAERVTFDRHGQPVLRGVHAGALWIAYGCVIADRAALAAFEATYAGEIKTALARSFDKALADDAELRLRERLVLVDGDDVPRLGSYSGRGDLRAWLRAAAIRTAIDLMRARRTVPLDADKLVDAALDPVLAGLKQQYRDEFRLAFGHAAATLTDRDRTLLRYRFADDLSIDEIGALYSVHRATVARWIATIRETLFEGTRAHLMTKLDLDEAEVDSVLRLIDSQLEASMSAVML